MRTRDHFQIDLPAPIPCLWGVAMPQHSKQEPVTVSQMAQGNQGATDQGHKVQRLMREMPELIVTKMPSHWSAEAAA